LLVFHASVSSATTVYVATDGSGDYNCDGKDDHVQINKALSYIHSIGGGTVYLKSGTYSAGDSIKIGDNTELTGNSDTKLMIENNAYFKNYVPLIEEMGTVGNIKIHGFELYGNYENNDEWIRGYGKYYMLIFMEDVDNIEVYDKYLQDNADDQMYLNGCSDVSVHDNIARLQGHEFVWVSKCDGVEIYNNDMSIQINSGIRSELTKNLKIHDNIIYAELHGGYVGIYVQSYHKSYPVTSVEIYNNIIYNTMYAGIYACAYDYGDEHGTSGNNDLNDPSQASDLYIHDNIVYNTGLRTKLGSPMGGIYVGGFDNTRIENNIVDGVYGDGITIMYNKAPLTYSGIDVLVKNNIIVNSKEHPALPGSGYGIHNWEPSSHSVVAKYNDVYNNVGEYSGENIRYSNNMNVNPLFVDGANHDYHLQDGSGSWYEPGWVIDDGLSQLMDTVFPLLSHSNNPGLNSKRVSIGVFGNTAQASKGIINNFISLANSNFIMNLFGKEDVPETITVSDKAAVSVTPCDGINITYGTVSIDGDLSDWQSTAGVTIFGNGSEDDTSAIIKAMYDDTYLYLAYDVSDSDLEAERVLGQGGLHLDDSVELYIDTLNNGGTSMQTDDYHFIINLNDAVIDDVGTGSEKDYEYVINMIKIVNLQGTVNDASDIDTGYIIEVAVPWSNIGGKTTPDIVGMLIAVNDMDSEGGLNKFNYCNIPLDAYAKPDNWVEATIIAPAN
jgi:hypothetical protein